MKEVLHWIFVGKISCSSPGLRKSPFQPECFCTVSMLFMLLPPSRFWFHLFIFALLHVCFLSLYNVSKQFPLIASDDS